MSWLFDTRLCSIKSGFVSSANPRTHVYDIWADDGSKHISVPLMSPYVNHEKGQGYTAVAKVGSRCIIGITENNEAFIMGFVVPIGQKRPETQAIQGETPQETAELAQRQASSYEGRAGNRPQDAEIDDQEIKGPSGNYIAVRSGGAVEVVSSDGLLLTRWVTNPGDNAIISVAEMIENYLPSGSFVWKTDYANNAGYFVAELKSQLDAEPDVVVKLGQQPEDDPDKDNRVTLTVTGSTSVKISVTKNGEVKIETKKLTIEADGDVQVKCKNAKIEAKSRVKISAGKIDLN